MSLRLSITVFLFFLALAVIFTAPISLQPHELAANDGDPLHIAWGIAWDAHQIIRNPIELFDSNTFYPYESSLAFSEHFLGIAVLGAPVFYLTGNALLAQNLTLILTLALSALAMCLLMKEIGGRTDAAIVAGIVYVFHTYNLHEVPRLQLLSIQWLPLTLLYLHRFFVKGGSRNAWLFGLFFTLQGLACTYYLIYLSLVLALWIPAYALFLGSGHKQLGKLVTPMAAAGGLFGLLSIPYLKMIREVNYRRPLAEGLDLLEYLRPPTNSIYANLLSFDSPSAAVVPQFLGVLVLFLAVVGIVLRPGIEDRSQKIFLGLAILTATLGLVLSLGPTVRVAGKTWGPGPYGFLYDYVPFFRVLRNAERISLLLHFGLAVVAGLGAKAVFSRLSGRALSVARIAVVVVLPMEHFNGGQSFTPIPTGDTVPEVYRWLGETPRGEPVVELPLFPHYQLRRHALYMLFSTYHWQPIVFGRTSFYPPLVSYLAWQLRQFPDPDSLGLLEGLSIERIVIHPKLWDLGERGRNLATLRGFADRLAPEGRFPRLPGPLYDQYGLGGERVFRLRRSGEVPSTSDLCSPEGEIAPGDWSLAGDAVTPHEWAIDRDRQTTWRTDGQLPGWKLEVDFGREEIVAAVRLELSYPYDQFPRDLTLKVRPEDGRFHPVDHRDDLATKWEMVRALVHDPASAAITLRFEPVRTRRLRFWVREGKDFDYALPDWAMPELHVYRDCKL